MQTLIASGSDGTFIDFGSDAYSYADAMMEARSTNSSNGGYN